MSSTGQKRRKPTIICAGCGERRPLKGSLHSKATGARWCATCTRRAAKNA